MTVVHQRFNCCLFALKHCLHFAVVAVSNPALHIVVIRPTLGSFPEEHALNIPADDNVGSGLHVAALACSSGISHGSIFSPTVYKNMAADDGPRCLNRFVSSLTAVA